MGMKAAVIIGVDKPGNMTPLDSAASGAEEVAAWLEKEGFKVKCLTDKGGSLTAHQVWEAIKGFVTKPPRYHMLLVYFSGHGQWNTKTDHWLLSGAPINPNEAINLRGSMELARYSGIPNVVFISDACRSIPESRTDSLVKGIDCFPNYQEITDLSKIDHFKAATESRSAYEIEIDGKSHGVLTYALKSAFESPKPEMVRDVIEGGRIVQVVPNRKLEDYLQPKVNELLGVIDDNLTQQIDINVPSADDIYISHVLGAVAIVDESEKTLPTADLIPTLTVGQDAANSIERDLSTRGFSVGGPGSMDALSVSVAETETELSTRLPQGVVDHFESETGFLVHGAVVVDVKSTKGQTNAWAEVLEQGNSQDQPAIIRVWDVAPAVSVLVKLEDGRSAILAGLHGYIGHARFDQEGLANVSYIPSTNNWRWQMYESKKNKIDRLRALVSVAVEHNAFNIRSARDATSLADEIRVEKAIDPTLGLYAAHAFNQASKDEHIASILQYMFHDLDADLFDVRVLSSRIKDRPVTSETIVPFCPMLTQTWNLLRPRGIELEDVLTEAQSYLCNSLWTTFQPEATDKIIQAIETGELK